MYVFKIPLQYSVHKCRFQRSLIDNEHFNQKESTNLGTISFLLEKKTVDRSSTVFRIIFEKRKKRCRAVINVFRLRGLGECFDHMTSKQHNDSTAT